VIAFSAGMMETPERDVAVYGPVEPTRLAACLSQPPFPARGFGVWICGQGDKYDNMPDIVEGTRGQPITPPQ